MWWQLTVIVISMVLSYVFIKLEFSDGLTIVLAFLPITLSTLYNNLEKLRLLFTKFTMRNKSVSVTINLKKTYRLKKGIDDISIIESNLTSSLIGNKIAVGKENNKLRIEGEQCIKSGKDNKLQIRSPLILHLQIDDNNLVCNLNNSYPGIVYKEIPYTINSLNKIWDLIDNYIEDCSESKLESTTYNAKIKVNSDIFKNVYLASYAPKYIKKLELKKENSDVKLTDDVLEIQTKSFSDFEKDILQYGHLFKNYFGNMGV